MGLYEIKCPACGQPHAWFSGNMDQRCDSCRNPRVWTLEADDIGVKPIKGPMFLMETIEVIEKSAFDFQVKQLAQVVESSNATINALNKQMQDLANQLMVERTETSRFQALIKKFRR